MNELYTTSTEKGHTHYWDGLSTHTTPDTSGHEHFIPSLVCGEMTYVSVSNDKIGGLHTHILINISSNPYDFSHSFDKMIKPGVLYRIELMDGTHQYHYAEALQQLPDGRIIALKCHHGIIFNWDNILALKEVYGSVNGTPAQSAGASR